MNYTKTKDLAGSNPSKFRIEYGVLLGYEENVDQPDEILIIPEGVETISCEAFADNESLKEVHLPNSLKEIGEFAFSNCYNLEKIAFREGLESIDSNAFFFCTSLQEVGFPSSLLYIGPSAFAFCPGLKKVVMNEGLRLIGNQAFEACVDLYQVEIPMSLRALGVDVFKSCDLLPRLNIPTCTKAGVDVSANKTKVEYTLTSWDKRIACYGNSGAIRWADLCLDTPQEMPWVKNDDFIEIYSEMLDIRENVLYGFKPGFEKDMPHFFIPSGVTKIAENAFKEVQFIKSVYIPGSVVTIGDFAFCGCTNLTELQLSVGQKMIGESAFANTGLKEVEVPFGTFRLEIDCFNNCQNLSKVKIHDGVVSIGLQAFKDCSSLESIGIPTTTKYIGTEAFSGCTSLKHIIFPRRINALREYTFKECTKLEAVVLLKGASRIHNKAFDGCVVLKHIVTTSCGKHLEQPKPLSKFTYTGYCRIFRKSFEETCKRFIVGERPRLLRG